MESAVPGTTPQTKPPESDEPNGRPEPRKGRAIAILLAILWLALLVGLYIVIVRLKMGGAEALRTPGTHAASPAPAAKPQ